MSRWRVEDLPDLHGRRYVVTGANSGLGLATVQGLASRGASVVMACRDPERGRAALQRVRSASVRGEITLEPLDLADLSSVASFAERVCTAHDRLHGLVNNAGLMAVPRAETADGFELQLGTNHLGHFALTGRLLRPLLAGGGARVVTVTSLMHKIGRIRFDDLMGRRRYEKWTAYGQSKLANLLFTFELSRRAQLAGLDLMAVAAHPGYAATNLQTISAERSASRLAGAIFRFGALTVAQDAHGGAQPTLFAAADPSVRAGELYGPRGPLQLRGAPGLVKSHANATDAGVAAELWRVSEQLTGVRWPELSRRDQAQDGKPAQSGQKQSS